MKRSSRAEIARQTVEIVERGQFELPNGRIVEIVPAVQACLSSTRLFSGDELERLRQDVLSRPTLFTSRIEVRNETTLSGIARLLNEHDGPVAALNFASAKNPGGGFLGGSQAQEESLARSSALHASLLRQFDFYERHRDLPSCLYSDMMILSPGCPIVRDDEGKLLEQPMLATFLTSAAPNAGAIATRAAAELSMIPSVFQRRSEYVLALAASQGYPSIVLGAWGCGVFRNDPHVVAKAFAGHLLGRWAGRFRRVVFSVLDTTPEQETLRAFEHVFEAGLGSGNDG